jgi:hypothetical protein
MPAGNRAAAGASKDGSAGNPAPAARSNAGLRLGRSVPNNGMAPPGPAPDGASSFRLPQCASRGTFAVAQPTDSLSSAALTLSGVV